MPFDGAMLASILNEIRVLEGGRVDKITQPERDEIVLAIRAKGENYKLMLTANANAPRLGFITHAKPAPLSAPMFCMVLRKHIQGGRITAITQPNFERIAEITIEALDEMGDRSTKTLIIEMMGKHSNILLLNRENKVLDAIKHVPPSVSQVRPIMPGIGYTPPPSSKANPLLADAMPSGDLFKHFNGISPLLAAEIAHRAQPDAFSQIITQIKNADFTNAIYTHDGAMEISAIPLTIYAHHNAEIFTSPSEMLEKFYTKRDISYRVQQKTADMRKLIATHLERARKKAAIFEKTLQEVQNRDTLRIKGELITAHLYMLQKGMATFTAQNFYADNTPLEIALDPTLTPNENAQKYFKKYNKQKRTFTALQEQIAKNAEDIAYLQTIAAATETATDEADIAEIRAELAEQGFIKRRAADKNKKAKPAKPLHFKSSDGFDIYVGKNNTQNDTLTMKTARANDIWLHTKDIAGSHVIIITGGKQPTETAIREAAIHAAQNSRANKSANVPVDYTLKKHVRKPAGAKPGYVIYDNHKTIYVTP